MGNKFKEPEEIGKGLNLEFCKNIKGIIRKSKTCKARFTEGEKSKFDEKRTEDQKTETYVIRYLVSEYTKGNIKIK